MVPLVSSFAEVATQPLNILRNCANDVLQGLQVYKYMYIVWKRPRPLHEEDKGELASLKRDELVTMLSVPLLDAYLTNLALQHVAALEQANGQLAWLVTLERSGSS